MSYAFSSFNRIRKLQDTLNAVHQLEKNVASLRCWLNKMEHVIGLPFTFVNCNMAEMQTKLMEHEVGCFTLKG